MNDLASFFQLPLISMAGKKDSKIYNMIGHKIQVLFIFFQSKLLTKTQKQLFQCNIHNQTNSYYE